MSFASKLAGKIQAARPSRKRGEMVSHSSNKASGKLKAAGPAQGVKSLASKVAGALKGAGR